jgi:hypothetical protein
MRWPTTMTTARMRMSLVVANMGQSFLTKRATK